jgi:hypothetical protein
MCEKCGAAALNDSILCEPCTEDFARFLADLKRADSANKRMQRR